MRMLHFGFIECLTTTFLHFAIIGNCGLGKMQVCHAWRHPAGAHTAGYLILVPPDPSYHMIFNHGSQGTATGSQLSFVPQCLTLEKYFNKPLFISKTSCHMTSGTWVKISTQIVAVRYKSFIPDFATTLVYMYIYILHLHEMSLIWNDYGLSSILTYIHVYPCRYKHTTVYQTLIGITSLKLCSSNLNKHTLWLNFYKLLKFICNNPFSLIKVLIFIKFEKCLVYSYVWHIIRIHT